MKEKKAQSIYVHHQQTHKQKQKSIYSRKKKQKERSKEGSQSTESVT